MCEVCSCPILYYIYRGQSSNKTIKLEQPGMDPSVYMAFTPPAGLPQESKLATYMNRNQALLNESMSQLNLGPSPGPSKKILVKEFIPVNYYAPPTMHPPESPEMSPPTTSMMIPPPQTLPAVHQENVGGTTYFYPTSTTDVLGPMNQAAMVPDSCVCGNMMTGPPIVSPYMSQMYAPIPAHIGSVATNPGLAASFYLPENIRAELYQRNQEGMYLNSEMGLCHFSDLPENVDMYTDLHPLDVVPRHPMESSYRATHRQSCDFYVLRRLHAYIPPGSLSRLEMWRKIDHPNIVKLQDYFTTYAFGDHSMVLVYDYHQGSDTLMTKYLSGGINNYGAVDSSAPPFHDPFSADPDAPRPYTHQKNAMLRAVACGALLPEAVLWSLLVQLTAALRTVHSSGLACRNIEPNKILITGGRVRVAWCSVYDVLHMPTINDIPQAQQDDLTSLGRLTLALACRTIHCDNLQASIELVARTYSSDLKNLILYLLTPTPARRSVNDLMPMIGARFYTQVEALERRVDVLEEQMLQEIDNGRLFRIMVKLGIINERPELNMDPTWSETGGRYLLKLFRDHIFHSVTPSGQPWIDHGHLAYCLNQLDAGSPNTVELISRDGMSILVVSYSELKYCLEKAYEDVMENSA